MSTLGIILLVIGGLVVLLLVGGWAAGAQRRRDQEPDLRRRLAEADRALEHARAADKGWDRSILEAAAREALAGDRPEWSYEELELVLVDDRPGVTEDRAHFMAAGNGERARIVLARRESGWTVERID